MSRRHTFDSCWRRPSDSWWGRGSEAMEQPLSRVHLSSTHWPPRLQTALQLGFKQHDSQQVAPPFPVTRGCQPSERMLLQCIPSTPPVTLQRCPDAPAQVEGFKMKDQTSQRGVIPSSFEAAAVFGLTCCPQLQAEQNSSLCRWREGKEHRQRCYLEKSRRQTAGWRAATVWAVSQVSKEEVRLFLAERH